jgi:DNA segregation ATPase FtsK/SpoIIIE, S-DNA-T family
MVYPIIYTIAERRNNMGRKRKRKPLKLKIRTETIHSVVAVILIALGLLVIISLTGQGALLTSINDYLSGKLGMSLFFLPFVFISSGMVMFRTKWMWSKPHVLLGTLFIMFGWMGFFQTGEIGIKTFSNISNLITPMGTYVTFFSSIMIGSLIITQMSVHELVEILSKLKVKKKPKSKKEQDSLFSEDSIKKAKGFKLPKLGLGSGKKDKSFSINKGSADTSASSDGEVGGTALQDSKKQPEKDEQSSDLTDSLMTPNNSQAIWEYPPLSLLSNSEGGKADRGDVNKNADIIEETLESFGIRAKVKEANYGPSVTQYALEIARGTKLSKITGLATDLALALAAPGGQVRIEAPIAGRSLVGVEVANYSSQFVTLRKMLSSPILKKHPSKLAVAMGINVSGKPLIADIGKMPHVLIAGATGSGKSVCINTFMCSILFRASPDEVKFILVDPKRVELTAYNNIPHLLTPVIVEPKKVVSALKWATHEMNNRYKKLAEVGVKNIAGYNELAGHAAMPSIVIVIDELADIMLFAPSEVEESITRIAQMARAVGIHLVLATQRPSVDVITGLIKANIPTRIAFNVSSMTDSRVVLDTPGAEKLLGKGDMLYVPPDQSRPSRVQGTYVSETEIKSMIDFIRAQGQKPEYSDDVTDKFESSGSKGGSGSVGSDKDELFDEVVKFVAQSGKGSSSSIQRRFSVGYNRAARILDQVYDAGMVGPAQGSKPREVNTGKIMEYLRSAGD